MILKYQDLLIFILSTFILAIIMIGLSWLSNKKSPQKNNKTFKKSYKRKPEDLKTLCFIEFYQLVLLFPLCFLTILLIHTAIISLFTLTYYGYISLAFFLTLITIIFIYIYRQGIFPCKN